jgi:hypothetical protein
MNLTDHFLFCGVLNLVDNHVRWPVKVQGVKVSFVTIVRGLLLDGSLGLFGVLLMDE